MFRPLADAGINVDMIVQNASVAGHTDISFTLPEGRSGTSSRRRSRARRPRWRQGGSLPTPSGEVSLVGVGMRTPPGSRRHFDALADAGINIELISTTRSGSRVWSAAGKYAELAVRTLHARFGLSGDGAFRAPSQQSSTTTDFFVRGPSFTIVAPFPSDRPPAGCRRPSATGRTFFRSAPAVVTRQTRTPPTSLTAVRGVAWSTAIVTRFPLELAWNRVPK